MLLIFTIESPVAEIEWSYDPHAIAEQLIEEHGICWLNEDINFERDSSSASHPVSTIGRLEWVAQAGPSPVTQSVGRNHLNGADH